MVSAPMVVVVCAFLVMLSMSASVLRAARGGELSAAVTGGAGGSRTATVRAAGCVVPPPLPAVLMSTPSLLGVSVPVAGVSPGPVAAQTHSCVIIRGVG